MTNDELNQQIAKLLGWTVQGYETRYWVSPEDVAMDPPNFLAPENRHLLIDLAVEKDGDFDIIRFSRDHPGELSKALALAIVEGEA